MVGGGTSWLWAAPQTFETVDVLLVDEAGQMSLANVLAVSPTAKTVVLIGDPQQLDQPTQGSYCSKGQAAPPSITSLMVSRQYRRQGSVPAQDLAVHPDICAFTSRALLLAVSSYRGRACRTRSINATGPIDGAGLLATSQSFTMAIRTAHPEEAMAAGALVEGILASNAKWVDGDKCRKSQSRSETLSLSHRITLKS